MRKFQLANLRKNTNLKLIYLYTFITGWHIAFKTSKQRRFDVGYANKIFVELKEKVTLIFDWVKVKEILCKKITYCWIWFNKLALVQRRVNVVLSWLNSEFKTVWRAKISVNQLITVTVKKCVLVITLWCQVQCVYDDFSREWNYSKIKKRLKCLQVLHKATLQYCTKEYRRDGEEYSGPSQTSNTELFAKLNIDETC